MAEYNLDALGWFQFERLVQSICKHEFGLDVEAWAGRGDAGRDAYVRSGFTERASGVVQEGPVVIQAKFVSGANAAGARPNPLVKAAVREELSLIVERRVSGRWKDPKRYVLMTNAPLSPRLRRDLEAEIGKELPGADISLQGAQDLDTWLDALPAVRLSFPQLLGLRDLEALLGGVVNADVVERSRSLIDLAKELAPVFVPTSLYGNALTVLNSRHFVVLTGPPEMGKTCIARMIALAKVSAGWDAVELRDPADLFKMHDPARAQVFIADDAFGSTEYHPELANKWAADLEMIFSKISPRHWVIWTSRPTPLQSALRVLSLHGPAEHFPEPGKVQVRADRLDPMEKALILYRHARAAELGEEALQFVKEHARRIVQSPHFTPLRIHRLVADDLPRIMSLPVADRLPELQASIGRGLREPTNNMRTSFTALPGEHKRLLVSMLDASAGSSDRDSILEAYERHALPNGAYGSSEVLDMLTEHFISVEGE